MRRILTAALACVMLAGLSVLPLSSATAVPAAPAATGDGVVIGTVPSPHVTDGQATLQVPIDEVAGVSTSGTVHVDAPAGFTAPEQGTPFSVAAHGSTTVSVTLTGSLGTALISGVGEVHAFVDESTEVEPQLFTVTAGDPTEPWRTISSTPAQTSTVPGTAFAQSGDQLAISAAGTDVWRDTAHPDVTTFDEYGAIYQPKAFFDHDVVQVRVDSQQATDSLSKAGIALRNDATKPGESPGYLVLNLTPGKVVSLGWDSNNDGYLDKSTKTSTGAPTAPLWLRLSREGLVFTASYSVDGTTWTSAGSATVSSAATAQDVAVFDCAHSTSQSLAVFSGFGITGPQQTAPAAPAAPTTSVAGTQVTVQWVKPADGGSSITGYTARLTSDTQTTLSAQAGPDQTSATFTNVPAGTWTASVVATNSIGSSGASPASAPVTVTGGTEPSDLSFESPSGQDLDGTFDIRLTAPAGTTSIALSMDGTAFSELTSSYAQNTGLAQEWRTVTDAAWFTPGPHTLTATATTPGGTVVTTKSVVTHRPEAAPGVTVLDGGWQFAREQDLPAGALAGAAPPAVQPGFDQSSTTNILVPSSFGAVRSAWNNNDGIRAVYRRTVDVPALAPGQHETFVLDSCYYTCRVYVNGVDQGTSAPDNAYLPARFDVTSALHTGENTIAVVLDNRRNLETNTNSLLYWNWGGILASVSLQRTDPVALTGATASGAADGTLTVYPQGSNTTGSPVNVSTTVTVTGQGVDLTVTRQTTLPAGSTSVVGTPIEIPVADPALWDTEHPNLYQVQVQSSYGAATTSTGFRTIKVVGADMYLNGEVVEDLQGFNRHADYPGLGRTQPDGLAFGELQTMREKGFTIFRPAHYPTTPGELDAADRLGILVIEEVNVVQRNAEQLGSEAIVNFGKTMLTRMIDRDRGHPSIFAWSVGNENHTRTAEGAQYVQTVIAHGRSLDASRLYTHASDQHEQDLAYGYDDFVAVNNYDGWYYNTMDDIAKTLDAISAVAGPKPLLLSEYGAEAQKGITRYGNGRGSEYYQALLIDEHNRLLDKRPHFIGKMYWTSSEFLVNPGGQEPQYVPQMHMKGLQTYFREAKLGWRVIMSPIRIDPLPSPHVTDGQTTLQVKIEDVAGVSTSGTVQVEAPAGFTAPAEGVPFSVPANGSTTVTVTLSGSLGGEVASGTGQVRAVIDEDTEAQPRLFSVIAGQEPAAPWRTVSSTPEQSFIDPGTVFAQSGDKLAINAAGADVWDNGTTKVDEYAAIYRSRVFFDQDSVQVRLDSQESTSDFSKAGLVVRNDMSKPGQSPGYVMLNLTPGHGVSLGWDSDGNGYLDKSIKTEPVKPTAPLWLRLDREGLGYTGWYSVDGAAWTKVGTATVGSAANVQDVAVIDCAHSTSQSLAVFSGFSITGPTGPQETAPASPAPPTATVTGADVTVRWGKPDDGGSPITGYTVRLSSATQPTLSAQAGADETAATFTDVLVGTWTASVVATNALGSSNPSPASAPFTLTFVDTTPPSVSVAVGGDAGPSAAGWWRGPATVTLTATDDGPSAPTVEVEGPGGWRPYTAPVLVTGDGKHEVAYRATDAAGNTTGDQRVPVWIDTTAPTSTLRTQPATAKTAGGHVTLSAVDALSGVASSRIRIDAGAWQEVTAAPVAILGYGQHTVAYYSVDEAGNAEQVRTAAVVLARPTDPGDPVVVIAPKIGGAARLGATLTATSGSTPGWSKRYQWLRDGRPIKGQTSVKHKLTAADVGHRIAVSVTASRAGQPSATAVSAPTGKVAKASSSVRVRYSRTSVKRKAKVRVTIRVTSPAGKPTGKVRIIDRGHRIKTLRLPRSGKVVYRVAFKKKGSHRLAVTYTGSSTVARSTSSKTTVKVR